MEIIDISVVVPVHNGENFIKKAYGFIISQEIRNIEILFVDNNSNDNSISVIKQLQELDSRVGLFQQPIQGAAAARNKGLSEAKGKYIYMFDVDDQMYPGALKAMKEVLDNYSDIDAVFGKMVKSHSDIKDTKKPDIETDKIVFKDKPYWGIHWFTDLKTVVGPPAFLYRRNVFDNIGHYEIELKTGQDTALDIKLGMLCNVAFIDRYIYLYLKHGKSTTDLVKKKMDSTFMRWPRFVKSHLPFYLNHQVPIEFKRILFKGIYGSMGRMLNLTQGFMERGRLKKQLFKDIKPLKTPWLIRIYLNILVVFSFSYVFKFYVYYLIPWLLPSIVDINDKQTGRE